MMLLKLEPSLTSLLLSLIFIHREKKLKFWDRCTVEVVGIVQ